MDEPRPDIPISRPYLWGDEAGHVAGAISLTEISGNSTIVREFERRFAAVVGRRHAVSAANGTAALQLALASLELPAKSEIIVPALCMMAPIFAALSCGHRVVPVEIDDTWNLDASKIQDAITPRTSAILAVHNFGLCADMPRIEQIARSNGLLVVEDAAEALGASVHDRQAGTFGDASCFSLYANKAITTGEGGMVLTDSPELAERLSRRRNLSFGSGIEHQYEHSAVGLNYRLSALQAAFGLGQVEHAAEAIARKRNVGLMYRDLLGSDERLTLQPEPSGYVHAYWAIAAVLTPELAPFRAAIQETLARAGIESRRFFAPVHSHAALSPDILAARLSFPNADRLYSGGICLPSFVGMQESQVVRVCDMLRNALATAGGQRS